MAKYPTPPSNPLKPKPTKRKKSIDFTPEEPSSKKKRIAKAVRDELPKPRSRPANPRAFSPQGRAGLESREMPKQIMGSTKAQRLDSAREMLDDMRSRNLLRSRNFLRERKKRGM
jgi:hypothetical protein